MEIKQIKALLPLLHVLAHYGLRPGLGARMRCPFHKDETPSMQLYLETNTYCCFSTRCEAGSGDVIDFIKRMEGSSTHEAILKAKALIGEVPAQNGHNGQAKTIDTVEQADEATRRLLLKQVFARFKKSFWQSSNARAYLKQRGLDAQCLEVGFNSGRFHDNQSLSGNEAWVKAGLLTPRKDGYKVFARTCLIFPLKDRAGEIVSLYGRSIRGQAKTARHFYLKHRCGLYPGYPDPKTRRLILTEAIVDAATLLMLKLMDPSALPESMGVLSFFGTNGFTPEHEQAIKSLALLEEIVLFFDGDQAGRQAVEKLSRRLQALRPEVVISVVQTLDDEDVNSLIVTYDADCIKTLIQERLPFCEANQAASSTEVIISENGKQGPRSALGLDTSDEAFPRFVAPEVVITVMGGIKLMGLDRLRVSLKLERADGQGYPLRHNLDLYLVGKVDSLVERAASELDLSTATLRRIVAEFTDQLERYRLRKIEALKPRQEKPTLTKTQYDEARAYLSQGDLIERTGRDIGRSGMVGEDVNRLLMYLVFTSRLRPRPLHLVCLAESGMGKTYLQESVSRLIPPEDRLEITVLSENALYYFGRKELKHKLILIEDLDGAQDVLYPLRELQSKGKLSKTVTMKDAKGRLKTITVTVEGPVCVSGCTTREALYDDNATRCLLLHLDTSPEQNAAILRYQKRLSAGAVDHKAQDHVRKLLQNT